MNKKKEKLAFWSKGPFTEHFPNFSVLTRVPQFHHPFYYNLPRKNYGTYFVYPILKAFSLQPVNATWLFVEKPRPCSG